MPKLSAKGGSAPTRLIRVRKRRMAGVGGRIQRREEIGLCKVGRGRTESQRQRGGIRYGKVEDRLLLFPKEVPNKQNRLIYVGSMLDQRRRRWPTLSQH